MPAAFALRKYRARPQVAVGSAETVRWGSYCGSRRQRRDGLQVNKLVSAGSGRSVLDCDESIAWRASSLNSRRGCNPPGQRGVATDPRSEVESGVGGNDVGDTMLFRRVASQSGVAAPSISLGWGELSDADSCEPSIERRGNCRQSAEAQYQRPVAQTPQPGGQGSPFAAGHGCSARMLIGDRDFRVSSCSHAISDAAKRRGYTRERMSTRSGSEALRPQRYSQRRRRTGGVVCGTMLSSTVSIM